ncbi:MAG: sensor histidine kinase [Pseudomonadota bacterium]
MSEAAEKILAREEAGVDTPFLASNVKTLSALVVAWGIVAVIATTTAFIAINGNTMGQWFGIFASMLVYYAVWFGVSIVIYRIVETFSASPAKRAIGVLLHVLLFVGVALTLPFLVHGDDWQTWLYGARAPGFHLLALVVYLLNLAGAFLIRFYRLSVSRGRQVQEARLRSSLLENQLNLARMDALKMQINPHFLFNALNSIAALIETDRKPEAYHATELLGGLLRSALEGSSDRFLPLEQEVDFVERYIEVEKVRFGSRIHFLTDVDEDCRRFEVPALLLQPFVENAIKHGVGRSNDVVDIELKVARVAKGVEIQLSDTGPGMRRDDAGDPFGSDEPGGVGLANIRKRLSLLYGEDAALEVRDRPTGGVRATLVLPQG